MKRIISLTAFIIFAQILCSQTIYLNDHEGHVKYSYAGTLGEDEMVQKYTVVEEQAMKAKMDAVFKYLKTNPYLASPKGIEVFVSSAISEKSPFISWCKSLRTEMSVVIYPWIMKNGVPDYKCDLCAVRFDLYFNQPERIFSSLSISGGEEVYTSEGMLICTEPAVIYRQDGCSIYENHLTVIEKNGPALFIPITVKEYDEALIGKYQKLSDADADDAIANRMIIARIKQEMESFSPEELNKPAFVGDKFGATPNKTDDEESKALVKLNSKYFNQSKPRQDVQLIMLGSFYLITDEAGSDESSDYTLSYEENLIRTLLKSFKYSELKQFFD